MNLRARAGISHRRIISGIDRGRALPALTDRSTKTFQNVQKLSCSEARRRGAVAAEVEELSGGGEESKPPERLKQDWSKDLSSGSFVQLDEMISFRYWP
jgi:hypothetical protein